MSWARRRQILYLSAVGGFLLLVFGVPTYFATRDEPTCFDGAQNADEQGVDCGGSCQLLCPFQAGQLTLQWTRAFPVGEGRYNLLAYVENPNVSAVSFAVPYRFQVFDDQNILLYEREGVMPVTRHGVVPFFEPGVMTGYRTLGRTFFEITGTPRWERAGALPRIDIQSEAEVPDDGARIEATVINEEVYPLENLKFVAAIFDINNNVMAASQTLIEYLPAGGQDRIVFTWPEPFPNPVGRIDITPLIPIH
jgi:hypothetical protein